MSGIDESADRCIGIHVWDLKNNRTDADAQNRDSLNRSITLSIPVNPPYLKPHKILLNELGLEFKNHYTTRDVCKVLNILPDTFRYRIRAGFYPEPKRFRGQRKFSEAQIRQLIKITQKLTKLGVLKTRERTIRNERDKKK